MDAAREPVSSATRSALAFALVVISFHVVFIFFVLRRLAWKMDELFPNVGFNPPVPFHFDFLLSRWWAVALTLSIAITVLAVYWITRRVRRDRTRIFLAYAGIMIAEIVAAIQIGLISTIASSSCLIDPRPIGMVVVDCLDFVPFVAMIAGLIAMSPGKTYRRILLALYGLVFLGCCRGDWTSILVMICVTGVFVLLGKTARGIPLLRSSAASVLLVEAFLVIALFWTDADNDPFILMNSWMGGEPLLWPFLQWSAVASRGCG